MWLISGFGQPEKIIAKSGYPTIRIDKGVRVHLMRVKCAVVQLLAAGHAAHNLERLARSARLDHRMRIAPLITCARPAACSEAHDPSLSYSTFDQEAKTATNMDAILNTPIALMTDGKFQGDGVLTGDPVKGPRIGHCFPGTDSFTAELVKKTHSVRN
jgi:hypothetical protein